MYAKYKTYILVGVGVALVIAAYIYFSSDDSGETKKIEMQDEEGVTAKAVKTQTEAV